MAIIAHPHLQLVRNYITNKFHYLLRVFPLTFGSDGFSLIVRSYKGPAKTVTNVNNTAPPRTTSNAPPPTRDTRTESSATRPTATPTIPKINTSLNKPDTQLANKSPRLSHGGSIADTEAPICHKCSKQVSGQTIEWMGNLYHKVRANNPLLNAVINGT